MGDRISISFKKGECESPVLFSHWGGEAFYERALKYTVELIKERRGEATLPLDRLEPGTVMMDFIREITDNSERVSSNLYLERSKEMGDNSGNGHRVIDLGELNEMSDLELKFENLLEDSVVL